MRLNKKRYSYAAKIIFGLLLMFLLIQFLGPVSFSTGVFQFEASLKLWGGGRTLIHFPPLGKIIAHTHSTPLDFHLTLKNINLEDMEEIASIFSRTGLRFENIIQGIKVNIIKYLAYLLLLAFFSGMFGMLLLTRRTINKKELLWGGLINFLVLLAIISTAALSYDTVAFSRAEYEGILEAAPWVLTVLQEGMGVVENIGGQFMEIVDNISFLQKEMEKNAPIVENKDTRRILHVSDIHNNPAAFAFMQRIVETFHIELIVDTGDLVDYGTSLEMELFAQQLAGLKIPYVFIPGKHDSPSVVEQLKKIENVFVLEEGIVEIAGLRIAGIADPASYSTAMEVANEAVMEDAAQKLQEIVLNAGKVDIIAAHNPGCFKSLRSGYNLLLGGHTHRPYVEEGENYLEINAGSTGAEGIRGIKTLEINFSLIMLNLRYSETERAFLPLSADLIKVKQYPLHFSFERFLFVDTQL